MPLEAVLSWWQKRTRWEEGAVVVWAGVLVALCVPSVLDPKNHSVYPVYESAGRNWLEGNDLYPTERKSTEFLFRYSPLVAALFAPCSLIPERVGNVVWRLLNAGVFLAALWWYCRRVLPESLTRDRLAGIFLMCVPLAGANIFNGQCNLLVLGFILFASAGIAASRWNLAALALGLACMFKVYPIALGLLLVGLYPRNFAPRFLLAIFVGILLPFVLQEPRFVLDQYRYWLKHMGENDRHHQEIGNWFRDPRLLLHFANIELSYSGYLLMEMIVGAAIAVFCAAAWLASVPSRALLNLTTCLACCWMTAFGPSTETCTYCFVAPAIGWLLVERGRHGKIVWGLSVCAFALLCTPIAAGWFGLQHEPMLLPLQPLGGILLSVSAVAAGILLIRASRRRTTLPYRPQAHAA